jgi:UDP-N-acetylglucosamine diphosphorylase/glucosamine-1-phosphate N-acetyltransferase
MQEAWAIRTGQSVTFYTEAVLADLYLTGSENATHVIYGGVLCTDEIVEHVMGLKEGEMLFANDMPIACCSGAVLGNELEDSGENGKWQRVDLGHDIVMIDRPWHLFQHCAQAIVVDMQLVARGASSQDLSSSNTVIGNPSGVFLDEGAQVEACVLNTMNGPIYIGEDAVVMEGSMIRGPFALGKKAQVKMGAKIYGASSFGPQCRIGGEVNNSVVLGYTNKGHDGFLGNSVLGEWCNLGADTNNSNLKNNYGEVRVYSYAERTMQGTGLQFCGLVMGDHSKAGINTMFNTGTVVGVCSNIFGGGFPPKHIPSFSWGGAGGFVAYEMEKALTTAHNVMKRRDVDMGPAHIALLQHIKERYGLGQS